MIKKKNTIARSLFKPRKTSCFLMDLRSTISLGSSRGCSMTLATYPAVPLWKSRMKALLGRGASSTSKGGAEVGATTQCSPLLSPLWASFDALRLLGPLQGLVLRGGMGFFRLHHLFTLLIPLPFVVSAISSGGWRGWWGQEALSRVPSHQVGTPEAPREMIFGYARSPFLQGWRCLLGSCLEWVARITDLRLWR